MTVDGDLSTLCEIHGIMICGVSDPDDASDRVWHRVAGPRVIGLEAAWLLMDDSRRLSGMSCCAKDSDRHNSGRGMESCWFPSFGLFQVCGASYRQPEALAGRC